MCIWYCAIRSNEKLQVFVFENGKKIAMLQKVISQSLDTVKVSKDIDLESQISFVFCMKNLLHCTRVSFLTPTDSFIYETLGVHVA